MPKYGDQKYWDKRYEKAKGETFDWLEDYYSLKPFLEQTIEKIKHSQNNVDNQKWKPKILNLGCGNSVICEQMYDNGYTDIHNIDISDVVISQMESRNQNTRPHMKFQVMNALDLQFPEGTFDLVIDKSTIDAILCGRQSFINASKMIFEVQKVLKPGGIYMIISYGEPQTRLLHLNRDFLYFNVQYEEIERYVCEDLNKTLLEQKHQVLLHFIYLCTKTLNYDPKKAKELLDSAVAEMEEEERVEQQMYPELYTESSEGDESDESRIDLPAILKKAGLEQDSLETQKEEYQKILILRQSLINQFKEKNIIQKNISEEELYDQMLEDLKGQPDYKKVLKDLGMIEEHNNFSQIK